MLDKQMMDQLEQVSNLDADEFYRNVAATQQAARGGFNWEVAATIAAGAVGYSVAALPGAIAAALVGAAWVGWKLTDSWDALNEIESGDFVKWLPEREKRLYQQEAIADLPASSVHPSSHQSQTQPPAGNNQVEELNLNLFDRYPSILIFGGQGSGKSSMGKAIAQRRASNGHHIRVLDPHGDPEEWGFPVIGVGMAYDDINTQLEAFHEEVASRYKQRSQGKRDFQPITLICDEFTNWAHRCEGSSEFFSAALSDIRKVNMGVIILSHTRTLKGLGNAAGMAAARDGGLIELRLEVEVDENNEPRPTGYGALKMPSDVFKPVKIPRIDADKPDDQAWKNLERLLEKDAEDHPFEPGKPSLKKLSPELQSIVEFAEKKADWITARQVRSGVRLFKNSGANTEVIREHFLELANLGIGTVDGDGINARYRI